MRERYLGKISVCLPKKLEHLISSTEMFDHIYTFESTPNGKFLNKDACWLMLLSLPQYFRVSHNNPVYQLPYLKAELERRKFWTRKIKQPGKFIIGIQWQGNPKPEVSNLRGRSTQLSTFACLADLPDVAFVSLQKGIGSEQLDTCPFRDKFVDCQDEIKDTWNFLNTAAIIKACDLIITIDSSTGHVAGGLGQHTYLMLTTAPDWRWGHAGTRTAWYPNTTLFRQEKRGDWDEVMQRIKKALHDKIAEHDSLNELWESMLDPNEKISENR